MDMAEISNRRRTAAVFARWLAAVALYCFAIGFVQPCSAGVPVKINYQGNLRQHGFLVNGSRNMVFRIYDSSTAAAALWTSPTFSVSVSTGVFRVTLEPSLNDWETGNLWLELEIDGVRLSPREEMTSAPYAVNSLMISGKRYLTSGAAPSSPASGDLWMDTSANVLKFWNGSSWIQAGVAGASLHAAEHSGDGGDPITILGTHTVTGYMTVSSAVTAGWFYGDGSGLTGLNAARISTGQFSGDRIAAGVMVSTHIADKSIARQKLAQSGCADGQVLKWDNTAGYWACAADIGAGGEVDPYSIHLQDTLQPGATFYVSSGTVGSFYVTGALEVYAPARIIRGAGEAGNVLVISTGTSDMVRMTGDGSIYANRFYGDISGATGLPGGDNLGNHTATQDLAMGSYRISGSGAVTASSYTATGIGVSAAQVRLGDNVLVSSEAQAGLGGGVRVSSNVYVVGFASATKYYGDGSALTGLSGADNLGNHTATQNLNMAWKDIISVSTISVSSIAIAGSGPGVAVSTHLYVNGKIYGDISGATGLPGGDNLGSHNATTRLNMGGNQILGVSSLTVIAPTVLSSSLWVSTSAATPQLYVSTTGNVGIGTSAPGSTLEVNAFDIDAGLDVVNGLSTISHYPYIGVDNYAGSTLGHPFIRVRNAGGTKSSPGATALGATLGGVIAYGHNASAWVESGRLEFYTENDFVTNNAAGFRLFLGDGLGGESIRLTATSAGNIGIGTATPAYRLVVSSGAGEAGTIVAISTGSSNVIRMTGDGSIYANRFYGDISGATGLPGGDNLGNHTATTALNMGGFDIVNASSIAVAAGKAGLTISTNAYLTGNVVVGTITPRVPLHVVGSGAGPMPDLSAYTPLMLLQHNLNDGYYAMMDIISGTDGKSMIQFGDADDHRRGGLVYKNSVNNLNDYFGIWAGGGAEKFVITSAGNTGVGNTNPSYKLHISSGAGEAGTIVAISTGSSNVIRMTGDGSIYANRFYGDISGATGLPGGDNLGNHTATTALNMGGFGIANAGAVMASSYTATGIGVSAAQLRLGDNVLVSSEAQAGLGGGVRVSSNVYVVGFASATKYYGDGSALTGISGTGDNLGNHNATQRLNMGSYAIWSSSDITATKYQIGGNTVLAVLPGQSSIGVGAGAGAANTGNYNSFFGSGAGLANSSGANNSFVGYYAGASNTTGGGNTFVGEQAGYLNDTGQQNSFFGVLSGQANTGGTANAFMGAYSGYMNTLGNFNSFFGPYSAYSNTSGASNSIMGYNAAYNTKTGLNNAVFGAEAGYGVANNSFSNSVVLGYRAGYGLMTGSDNVLIGYQAGDNLTSGARNIIVGYDQDTSAPGASNELNIGGVLFGDLSARTIGISTRVPQAALDIVSTGTAANIYTQIWRNGSGVIVASMTSQGALYATLPPGAGDNLGNHTATQDLQMSQKSVLAVGSMTMVGKGLQIGTDLSASANGVLISTSGQILTIGLGNGTAVPNARGMGAVDLQTRRTGGTQVASGNYSVIGGGDENRATALSATVGGGSSNLASGEKSTVSGGGGNAASGAYFATVGGGGQNTAGGAYSYVGGGYFNAASGDSSVIGGGWFNKANTSQYTTVGGGEYNTATGLNATVPGGSNNTAKGDYSFAAGRKSSATAQGAFALSDSQNAVFEVGTADQFGARFQGGYLFSGGNVGIGAVSSGAKLEVAGQIKITGGTPGAGKVLTSDAAGLATWTAPSGGADNLGDHNAAQRLNMGNYAVWSSSDITAVKYQISGNTVLSMPTAESIAVGPYSGAAGSNSVFVGKYAGTNNSGTDASFLGYQAGYSNSGNENTFVGAMSGRNNTTAYNNSFFGSYSGNANTTGLANSFIGYSSGRSNIGGNKNSFLGAMAGFSNTEGLENSFAGSEAGYSNITGSYNSFFGVYSGYNNTASNNTFIGHNSGYENTSGKDNSYLGYQSGLYNRTGAGNAALGAGAGRGLVNNSFSSSTLVGYHAGYFLSTGNDNILLGFQAGDGLQTGSRNIIIGYDQDAPASNTSNHLNIGGAIYGDLSTGNVGIGAVSPGAKLEVAGQIKITGGTPGAGKVLTSDAAGLATWTTPASGADNLGSHIATTMLNMAGFGITNVSTSTYTGYINVLSTAGYAMEGVTILRASDALYGTFVGREAGRVNTGLSNAFIGYRAGFSNTTGNYNSFLGYHAGLNNTTGLHNSFLGYQAGYLNTIGEYNAFLGSQAGYSNTSGWYNSFIGAAAGANNTTGEANSFLGYAAGGSNTTGAYNSLMGYYAGYYTQSGSSNTISGYRAGYGASGNSYAGNSLYGYQAGFALTTGSSNTFVGSGAGGNATSGGRNIVIGYNANVPSATGSDQLNIGNALYGNLSAKTMGVNRAVQEAALDIVSTGTAADQMAQIWRDNTGVVRSSMSATGVMMATKFIGDGSGLSGVSGAGDNLGNHNATQRLNMGNYAIWSSSSVTAANYQINGSTVLALLPGTGSLAVGSDGVGRYNTGSYNLFVGNGAALSNSSGNYNTFLGYSAGVFNNTGTVNTFVGAIAGYFNTTGAWNSYFGYRAGNANTTGSYNNFLGAQSGYANTTGNNNLYVGYRAGSDNTTGERNVLLGNYVGYSNVNGSANTILGDSAAYGVGGNSFSSATLVGYRAGYGLTTGSDNILLGFQAGDSLTTGTRNIIIGYDKDAPAATTSNHLNIGDAIYGDLSTGNVGIGAVSPGAKLEVAGQIKITGGTPGAGKVLTSDAAGLATWTAPSGGADNLGNHTATQDLLMGGNDIYNTSTITAGGDITAARYQINGSTVLAVLPGSGSMGIGIDAGKNSTGVNNIFVGYQAGYTNTTGNNNLFAGFNAGYSNNDGADNSFVGSYAGWANTSGSYNSFVGQMAGQQNTSAWYNSFIGYAAGNANTLGWYNSFMGASAGEKNTTGVRNSFMGYGAGYANTTGDNNSIIGYSAGYNTKTGSANAIFGSEAAKGVLNNSFSSATLMGYHAGYGLTTGSDNILLGFQAGDSLTTGTRNIIIGYDLDASAASASNELNIGGIYKGNIAGGTATIPKVTVQAADAGITVTAADFGKTITVNSASAQIVTLPSVSAADIGATITVIKLGAGTVTIDAPAGAYIADSGSGGTVYNNVAAETYATITLRLATSTMWSILCGNGSWTTTN